MVTLTTSPVAGSMGRVVRVLGSVWRSGRPAYLIGFIEFARVESECRDRCPSATNVAPDAGHGRTLQWPVQKSPSLAARESWPSSVVSTVVPTVPETICFRVRGWRPRLAAGRDAQFAGTPPSDRMAISARNLPPISDCSVLRAKHPTCKQRHDAACQADHRDACPATPRQSRNAHRDQCRYRNNRHQQQKC